MPTANRRLFVPAAIGYFLTQDYAEKELIILDDGEDEISDLIPLHPQIRYVRETQRQPLGRKRNKACEAARGDIIAHWDDDDWYAPFRLRRQFETLTTAGADICGIDRVMFLDKAARRAWEYTYPHGRLPWIYGATLCFRKSFWRSHPFPEIGIGEDGRFVSAARGRRIAAISDNGIYVGMIHGGNTSPKQTRNAHWRELPVETIEAVMRTADAAVTAVDPTPASPAIAKAAARPAALVTAAGGIGDIVRVTPLIRVLDRLGYAVDFLLAPDDPGCVDLFRGAPELCSVMGLPGSPSGSHAPLPEAAHKDYALATFTTWSAPLARSVKSKQSIGFSRAEWLKHGDLQSVERIARAAGWDGPLPAPFVKPSARMFDLPAGTIALHPGCKADWPWKKWHGFDALARLLPHVAIVGTPSDEDNSRTYFRRSFDWPEHAHNFIGTLNLADTAALIRQCAALIANDSGLMHLGVALGVPTFGIFGITSPARELIPAPHMVPVTKQLDCEPACRRKPWGRRDCEHHLACLKELTAADVAAQVQSSLPGSGISRPRRASDDETITLNYFGNVFDASGYGQAARAYVHALHAAGVKVSVINTGSHPAQIDDGLLISLLGMNNDADFNLFHGIPTMWAPLARRRRNLIAMTVWETDTMPHQWREPLAQAVDVWLPCRFNADVFTRGLGRRAFILPHALPPKPANGGAHADDSFGNAHFAATDFVFYSIFEWQDRKNPAGTIEAFLRAFPEPCAAVLVLKAGPNAAAEAKALLERIRATTGSRGRVVLCCEAWTDAQVDALHRRGDSYVSLHKGEGWGYPLFEAAARGKPVVATNYSGPCDYLEAASHWLVKSVPAHVRQHYRYYQSTMKWAVPDIGHAAEGMRWVYDNRDIARAKACDAKDRIAVTFSLERIGALAKTRLISLLHASNPKKAMAAKQNELRMLRPAAPISGLWFDDNYFEHGLKSNWTRGYTWPLFNALFRETARFLTEMFPDARSFLDIGCAKGFLVRALHEQGREAWGFDHSPWAIAHADPAAKPYLQLAGIESARYDRQFDVLVVIFVLESLDEAQIRTFLTRARPWAIKGILAVIATTDGKTLAGPGGHDRDLSRVTLRDRNWWRDQFIASGWRQDEAYRELERRCQTHPLACQMGWTLLAFSAEP